LTTGDFESSKVNAATQAAEWLVTLRSQHVSSSDCEDFADWLRSSPLHVEDFLRLAALEADLLALIRSKGSESIETWANLDLERASNVVALRSANGDTLQTADPAEGPDSQTNLLAKKAFFPDHKGLLAVASTLVFAVVGVNLYGLVCERLASNNYRTVVGEQRSLALPDGSRVQLNAQSSLTSKVNATERDLSLNNGEALFEVARDPSHPFRVHTPQATIEAKGTQFDVHVVGGVTIVSLIEGHVQVTLPSISKRRIEDGTPSVMSMTLNPGEQITVSAHSSQLPQARPVDVKVALAWTQHRLAFENAPLSDVISEFNRYSSEPFIINDPSLAALRITVNFDSSSSHAFAESLSATGVLQVNHSPTGWIIERR
jgi:transmembrane sensor